MFRKIVNKQKWKALLKEPEISLELRNAIDHFLLQDNIDYEKYLQNMKANEICMNGPGLETWEMANKLSASENIKNINCTPTFRKHFANDRLRRAFGIPDWFYIAYPDVEVWIQNRRDILDKEYKSNPEFYSTNGILNKNLYRFIIDKYKALNSIPLECSI